MNGFEIKGIYLDFIIIAFYVLSPLEGLTIYNLKYTVGSVDRRNGHYPATRWSANSSYNRARAWAVSKRTCVNISQLYRKRVNVYNGIRKIILCMQF